MSIISDALKKVADKRIEVVRLQADATARKLNQDIKKGTTKNTKWSILSGVGTFFIVGFAITAFLYNTEFFSSFIHPSKAQPIVLPERIALEKEAIVDKPKAVIKEKIPSYIVSRPKSVFRKKAQIIPLTLNGIIEGQGEPLAIINNNILKAGDYVDGARVINIGPDRVVLFYDNKEILLRIK